MVPAEKIIVALDFSDKEQLFVFFKSIQNQKVWVKVGMELFYSMGPEVIYKAKEEGFNVFLDLKLHDIPNTVEHATKALLKLPIDMINVHAAGGSEMMKRAAGIVKSHSTPPLLIAVTQLTSTTQEQMNTEQGISGEISQSVANFAQLSQMSGCDGVVSSPLEVRTIKELCGKHFLTVTPGIRPLNSLSQDQKRITTPEEALLLGTDYMVIGRPITESPDPKKALENILQGQ